MNKGYFIYILLFIPGILFSQNFNKTGVTAFTHIKNTDYSKALDSLDKLILEHPKPEFYLAKAESHFKLGELNNALEYC
ncbi:tol-pal system YbgF family protein, partial [Bacteroidota bacterium]